MAGTKLSIVRGEFRGFPEFCASCLSTSDLQYRTIKAPGSFRGNAFETSIPLCAACMRRIRWLYPTGTGMLFVVAIWLNYKLTHIQLPRLISALLVLLPIVHSYATEAFKGPVRVRAKRGDILEFSFNNHEYARLFELQNPCIGENSEMARMI
jgi:hypothetical protein